MINIPVAERRSCQQQRRGRAGRSASSNVWRRRRAGHSRRTGAVACRKSRASERRRRVPITIAVRTSSSCGAASRAKAAKCRAAANCTCATGDTANRAGGAAAHTANWHCWQRCSTAAGGKRRSCSQRRRRPRRRCRNVRSRCSAHGCRSNNERQLSAAPQVARRLRHPLMHGAQRKQHTAACLHHLSSSSGCNG